MTTPAGRFTVTSLLARLPRRAWQRLRADHGTKGDRHYDWAMIGVEPDDTPPGHDPGHSVLLVRRHRYTGELSFYRCHSTAPADVADLVSVVCTRCRIEEDIRAAKSLTGLDHGQVTCWNSWMRWSLISLVAAALLAVALARTRSAGSPPATGLIPLTRPELLALLQAAVLPAPRAATWRTPCTGHAGAAVTSTAQRPATADGTRSPPPPYEQNGSTKITIYSCRVSANMVGAAATCLTCLAHHVVH